MEITLKLLYIENGKDDIRMKIHGYFLEERLTKQEKQNLYDECIGCLNRICVTDDKTEVLTLLASLQCKAMILGKNTFLRIDEENTSKIK